VALLFQCSLTTGMQSLLQQSMVGDDASAYTEACPGSPVISRYHLCWATGHSDQVACSGIYVACYQTRPRVNT